MRTSARTRNAVCIITAAALLTACGGNLNAPGGIPEKTAASAALSHHQTFEYTGAKQTFTVPDGVTLIKIVALGASGGGGSKTRVQAATVVVLPPRSSSPRRSK
jgi:hypothetical protein